MARGGNSDLAVIISANTDPLSAGLRAAARDFTAFNKAVARQASPDISATRNQAKELAAYKRMLREVASEHRKLASEGGLSFAKLTGATFAAGAALKGLAAAGMGVGEVFRQIGTSVKMAADLERTAISFEVMLQSGERARDMIRDLRRFAAETPFGSAETITAAKQLMAYGIAAADVIPTLKMLGNVTAPIQDDTTLREMAYLYGTLAAQQRAYTKDLNQFANRGIPIFQALGKQLGIDTDQVRLFAEEGRIGFTQVARALESLQLKGGLFHGMLEKQAKSLHGLWEQTTDAFDRVKIAFGQMLIEELDLKQVVTDLKEFAENLAAGADMRGLRQGVRLVGDFGKAVAHVGYELGRAAFQSADVFAEMASETQVFRDTLLDVRNIIRGLNEFKLDPVDVARFAVDMSKDILAQGGAMVMLVARAGDAFHRHFLVPLGETLKFLRDTVQQIRGISQFVDSMKPWNILRETGRNLERLALKRVGMDPGPALTPGQVVKSEVDEIAGEAFAGMRDFGKALEKLADTLDRTGESIVRRVEDRKRIEQLNKEAAELAARRRQMAAVLTFTRAAREGAVGPLTGLGAAGDPLAGIAAAAGGFRREMQKVGAFAAIGGGPMAVIRGGALGEPRLGLAEGLDANLKDLARQLNDEFAPYQRLMRDLGDIDTIRKAELVTPRVAELAREKRVRSVAEALGIGGKTELPDSGAERGSAEAVRLMNQFMSGRQAQTVEDLLAQIRDLIKMQNAEVANQGREMARPTNVFSPF